MPTDLFAELEFEIEMMEDMMQRKLTATERMELLFEVLLPEDEPDLAGVPREQVEALVGPAMERYRRSLREQRRP